MFLNFVAACVSREEATNDALGIPSKSSGDYSCDQAASSSSRTRIRWPSPAAELQDMHDSGGTGGEAQLTCNASSSSPWPAYVGQPSGSTSWMSSFFHCLGHIPELSRLFIELEQSLPAALDRGLSRQRHFGGDIVEAVAAMQSSMWSSRRCRDSLDIRNAQRKVVELATELMSPKSRQRFKRRDTGTLQTFCLHRLHEELLQRDGASLESESEVSRLFRGQLSSSWFCTRCGAETSCTEPFLDLCVPVAEETAVGVTDILGQFLSKGVVIDTVERRCASCSDVCEGRRCATLHKLPPILAVSLSQPPAAASVAEAEAKMCSQPTDSVRVRVPGCVSPGISGETSNADAAYDVVAVVERRNDKVIAKCLAGPAAAPSWYMFQEDNPPESIGSVGSEAILSASTEIVFLARRCTPPGSDARKLERRRAARGRVSLHNSRGYKLETVTYTTPCGRIMKCTSARHSLSSQASTDIISTASSIADMQQLSDISDEDVSDCETEEYNVWGESDNEDRRHVRLANLHPHWRQHAAASTAHSRGRVRVPPRGLRQASRSPSPRRRLQVQKANLGGTTTSPQFRSTWMDAVLKSMELDEEGN
eukprot:TRINITY_DN23729_c0_g2_i1.p1 TRINITY_DN23729_c0_g2~~TRINITY_DN23729_c0_g2_i1.p1  ORF type:complete len:594 (-),score=85.85 TRINITY_DN23729_c0_g2_i1:367-2148(-)